jgi:hypothetical protein
MSLRPPVYPLAVLTFPRSDLDVSLLLRQRDCLTLESNSGRTRTAAQTPSQRGLALTSAIPRRYAHRHATSDRRGARSRPPRSAEKSAYLNLSCSVPPLLFAHLCASAFGISRMFLGSCCLSAPCAVRRNESRFELCRHNKHATATQRVFGCYKTARTNHQPVTHRNRLHRHELRVSHQS